MEEITSNSSSKNEKADKSPSAILSVNTESSTAGGSSISSVNKLVSVDCHLFSSVKVLASAPNNWSITLTVSARSA